MRVIVRSAVSECQLDAPPKTPIREVFQLMCKNLLVTENWYFGILYKGADNEQVWVDGSKKSLRDLRAHLEKFVFKVKYYPEDVAEELIEKSTIELFFAEVKRAIFRDEIYCPPDTCALLASYALQGKYGDYDGEKYTLKKENLIPERILNQHAMEISEWDESIVNMWKKHQGIDNDDAMMEYLKLVQNLEMYGIAYFEITNRKGSNLLLGVGALGINIYRPEDKMNPQIAFPWSEIKNLKFRDRKFTIKPTSKTTQDFVFYTTDPKISKHILNLGIGNHSLYVKRRKPDTPEIAKLKERAREFKKMKQSQRDKLTRERLARHEVERKQNEYVQLIASMKEDFERSQASLLEAQKTIQRLQQQLEDLQRAKEELERQQLELREMMERLERAKHMEAEEKQKLEDEIRAKQEQVQRIQDEVAEKDAETRRLQEEVEEAKRREEELKEAQIAEAARLEEERKQRELEEANKNERELETVEDDNALPELVAVNEQLKDQLKMLQEKLEGSRNQEMETELDKIHRVNLREGIDKYKTLADIRRGNTVRRVEMFENM